MSRWGGILALTFAHCGGASTEDAAARAVEVGRTAYGQAASLFEATCTERYRLATTAEQVEALDARCLPARDALEAHRFAVQALEAAVAAKREGEVLRDAVERTARSADAVVQAFGGMCVAE